MVKYRLKNRGKSIQRLSMLLFSDARGLVRLAWGITLLAWSFSIFFASLNHTIVDAKQQSTLKAHGKFLGLFADITREKAEEIMEKEPMFDYGLFQVQDALDFQGIRFFSGWAAPEDGGKLGIFLKEGVWPKEENEILVEEYLAEHCGVRELPQRVVFLQDGQEREYMVCGIVGNYSSGLPISDNALNERRNYPSVITANYREQETVSLIFLQKRLNLRNSTKDIYRLMELYEKYGIDPYQTGLNEYLESAYSNTEDFEKVSLIYMAALLLVVCIVEKVLLSAIFVKTEQARRSLGELGLGKQDIRRIYAWELGKRLAGLWGCGMLAGILWAKLGGYITGYGKLLEKHVWSTLLRQSAFLMVFLPVLAFMIGEYTKEQHARAAERKKGYRYLFRKINLPMLLMQSVFLVFVLFSFCMQRDFVYRKEEIRISIRAQRAYSLFRVGNYAFSDRKKQYFEKESGALFEKYADIVDVYMGTEMQYASLICPKDQMSPYFENLLAASREPVLGRTEREDIVLSQEAEQYAALRWDDFGAVILPD